MTLSRWLLVVMCTSILAIGGVGVLAWRAGELPVLGTGTPASASAGAASVRPEVRAAQILHGWDVRRSRAWAAGDGPALRRLYTPTSSAGRRDVAMLRAWNDRGVRVDGWAVQLISVQVRTSTPDRLVLRVIDRMVGGRVTAGRASVQLPRDRPSRRTVELRRGSPRSSWRVHSVRSAHPRPARSTASTWRSRTS